MTTRRMPRMPAAHVVIAAAVLAAACAPPPPSLNAAAEGYVRAALRLAQHDPTLVEAWRGPAEWQSGPRQPVAAIADDIRGWRTRVDAFGGDAGNAVEKARIDYLRAQLQGLAFAADRLLGRSATIDDQARDEFGVAFPALDAAAIERSLVEIDRILPGRGPLADRVAALRKRTTIPDDRRQAVMELALGACREAAAPLIELPADERVTIAFRSDLQWDAVARDTGHHHTSIDINDGPLDMLRAYHLACHEGYAGHHAQYLLIDRLVDERHWPELQLTPGFGPHLLFIEGTAEAGADLAMAADRRATLYRERLMPAAGLDPAEVGTLIAVEDHLPALLPIVTDVARQYLASAISREQAIVRLRNEALLANPAGTLAFIERRRARALVYGEGRRLVHRLLPAASLAGLRDLFRAAAAVQ